MKKKKLYAVTTLVSVAGLCLLYYFYPRNVHFELAKEIEKPNPEFDRSYFVGFEYIENKESLFFFMVYRYEEPPFRDMKGYDTFLPLGPEPSIVLYAGHSDMHRSLKSRGKSYREYSIYGPGGLNLLLFFIRYIYNLSVILLSQVGIKGVFVS